MTVGFVARPTKASKREDNLPPIRDDLARRVTHPAAMICVVEEQRGERANDAADEEAVRR